MPNNQIDRDQSPYLELVRRFPLRPLRSDEELDRAGAIVDALLDAKERSLGEDDYLDVLSDLIERYEEEHHPIPAATEADTLRFLMDARELSQTNLAEQTKIPVSVISEVLSGKRGLSKHNIGVLANHFHVSPAVFFG